MDGAQGGEAAVIDRLYAVIESRRGADPAASRTARLFAKGLPKIAQKVGEEATETVVAALAEERQDLVAESADLIYHLLVLWAARGVRPQEVWTELELRARAGSTAAAGKPVKKRKRI